MRLLNVPDALHDVDFCRIVFWLEFRDSCQIDSDVFLTLRGLLRTAAKRIFDPLGPAGQRRFRSLFDPDISHDPVALKIHQKPSPPFVIRLQPFGRHSFRPQDVMGLEVLFWGKAIPLIADFHACLDEVGRFGLVNGQGRFATKGVSGIGEDGQAQNLCQGKRSTTFAPPLIALTRWLEDSLPSEQELLLEFQTPVRLMVRGRPLRRPDFQEIFPFALRRVTSVLYAHTDVELPQEARQYVNAAVHVSYDMRKLKWRDWKDLSGTGSIRSIGGFVGTMTVQGEGLREVGWILATASLLGIGKGAAYGAGRFRLGTLSQEA